MSWNPFKRKDDEPEAPAATTAQVEEAVGSSTGEGAAEDRTDPLGSPPAEIVEEVELLGETSELRRELVRIGSEPGSANSFVRITAPRESAHAQPLQRIFTKAAETTSGLRDMLFVEGSSFAAALDPPLGMLTELAAQIAAGELYVRPLDLIAGVRELAEFAMVVEDEGFGWNAAASDIGYLREGIDRPLGQQRLRFIYCAWENLQPSSGSSPADLLKLFEPQLDALHERAVSSGFSFGANELEILKAQLARLGSTADLSWQRLAHELANLRPLLRHSALTDPGMRRTHNEDAYSVLELEQQSSVGTELLLAAVADGMGGHASGEVASTLALDLLRQQLMLGLLAPRSTPRDTSQLGPQLKQIITSIDNALTERAQFDAALAGMGTTLCGLALLRPVSTVSELATDQPTSVVFWVGDSRVYLLGPAGLAQISRDHSVVQGLVDSGSITADQAFSHPNKNIITRCLGGGGGSDGTPDIAAFTAGPGEIVLVCSDGLSDALRDGEIWQAVLEGGSEDLSALATELVRRANDAGGPDNITVVLVASVLPRGV